MRKQIEELARGKFGQGRPVPEFSADKIELEIPGRTGGIRYIYHKKFKSYPDARCGIYLGYAYGMSDAAV